LILSLAVAVPPRAGSRYEPPRFLEGPFLIAHVSFAFLTYPNENVCPPGGRKEKGFS